MSHWWSCRVGWFGAHFWKHVGFSLRKVITMSGNWVAHGKCMYHRRKMWFQKLIVWVLVHKPSFNFLILSSVYFCSSTPIAVCMAGALLLCMLTPPDCCLFVQARRLSCPPQESNLPLCEQRKYLCVEKCEMQDIQPMHPCIQCDLAFSDE